uniref:RNA polymerase Rpb4/RPC9 core domain-containing protein n=1 Tax=Vombatus ursinus TaxID=29139 RepID=A0A4X2LAN6_VOMUR
MAARGSDPCNGNVEEDALKLLFPKEFEAAETLLNSEVHMFLQHQKQQNGTAEDKQELSEIFRKTFSYITYSDIFKTKNHLPCKNNVQNLLLQKKNEELQQILNYIQTKRSFQYQHQRPSLSVKTEDYISQNSSAIEKTSESLQRHKFSHKRCSNLLWTRQYRVILHQ